MKQELVELEAEYMNQQNTIDFKSAMQPASQQTWTDRFEADAQDLIIHASEPAKQTGRGWKPIQPITIKQGLKNADRWLRDRGL
jgi:hypothetical protein